MASTPEGYPLSHDLALQHVMRVVDLIAAHPASTDEELKAELVRDGIGEVDAGLLIWFVPCAMSFALLKLMGMTKFPSMFQVKSDNGQWVESPLASEHYFTAALTTGYLVTTQGYSDRISKETFQAVTSRSAEMNAVNRFFEAGHTIEELAGSSLGSPTLIGITLEQIVASRQAR